MFSTGGLQRAAVVMGVATAIFVCPAGCRRHKKTNAEPLPSIEELTGQMQSSDDDTRYEAVRLLGEYAPSEKAAVPLLIAALSDANADVRWVATKGIESFGTAASSATARLTELLRDPSSTVRAGAARALSTMGAAGLPSLTQLTNALHDPEPEVREEAQRAITAIREVQKFQSLKPK